MLGSFLRNQQGQGTIYKELIHMSKIQFSRPTTGLDVIVTSMLNKENIESVLGLDFHVETFTVTLGNQKVIDSMNECDRALNLVNLKTLEGEEEEVQYRLF